MNAQWRGVSPKLFGWFNEIWYRRGLRWSLSGEFNFGAYRL